MSPAVLQEGHELQLPRIGLLGDPAHGLFHWEPGPNATPTLSLLQLTQPLTRELRQLLAEGSSLTIPPADEHRFTTDYVPQLRQKVAITSTDGSVSLPEYQPPVLTLLATFKEEHRLRLDWAWEYRIGDSVATFDLDEPVRRPSVRDVAEEQRQLERLPLPYDKIPQLAEVGGRPRPASARPVGRGARRPVCRRGPSGARESRRAGHPPRRRAGLPRDRSAADDRGLHRRERRGLGLVRPAHRRFNRERGSSFRSSVRRPQPAAGLSDLGYRRLLSPRPAGA